MQRQVINRDAEDDGVCRGRSSIEMQTMMVYAEAGDQYRYRRVQAPRMTFVAQHIEQFLQTSRSHG